MKKFKSTISILLAVIMLLSTLPFAVGAADTASSGQCGDNVYWTLDEEGTLTISGEGDMYDYSSISDSPFCESELVKNIVIEYGVTSIGNHAFPLCESLKIVTIPNSVTSIGNDAFYACKSLTNVTLPEDLTSIGEAAFNQCSSIKEVIIPNNVTSIGKIAFAGCSELTRIVMSDKISCIDLGTFGGCTSLIDVTLPFYLSEILINAFIDCNSLKEITIPQTVNKIEEHSIGYIMGDSLDVGDKGDEPSYEKIDNFTINGYAGSEAERYANDNGFKFNSIGSEHTHSYVSSVTKSPTCTEDGVRTYTCSCGDSYTEKISATGHETEHVEIPSTCTVCGVSYDVCTKCSETFNYTVLPLAEHTFGEYKITKQPTYTQEGEREAICTVCGFKITESIAKLVATNESKDDKTGISVGYNDDAFEEDIVLSVTEVFDGMSFNVLNNEKGNFKNELFDIVIKSGDENVQPNTSVLVSIPLPDGYNPEKTVVYYVTNDDRLEKLDSHYENGYIVFEASHFSHYAIVDEGSDISNPTDNCTCLCHKTGFVGFIYKIVRLFWKLFKINKTCSCGAVHY